MTAELVVLVVGLLMPLAAIWTAVVWIRPAVARARVEHEALLVRDRVMDGILSGDIARDDPRAQDVVMFSEFLAKHSNELSLSVAIAVAIGMKQAGVDMEARYDARMAARQGDAMATEGGKRRLQEAERDLDHVMARFYVRSSALWWILAPLQRLSRYLHKRHVMSSRDVVDPLPGELATELREASRGHAFPPSFWTVHGFHPA